MKIILPNRLTLFTALLLSLLLTSPIHAAPQIMSAPEAQAAIKAGKLFLLDIRAAEEWKEDGVAEGAFPVSMHENSFGKHLNRILTQRGDKKLGLICATGGRTQYVAAILEKNGITDIVDVSESMHGNHNGPGWLKRKLPVVTMDEALKHFAETIK
ncbi:MAG: rhodanese-like domain-containing protein [Thiolinea sp.]